jgi:hypothetical protein
LESIGSRRERNTEENLGKDLLEEIGKCGKTWSEFKRLAGNSQMEMLRKWPMLLMELKHTLLGGEFLVVRKNASASRTGWLHRFI